MSDFINTIDALGDDAVMDSLIDRSITEFKDNQITSVGNNAFYGCTSLTSINLPNVTTIDGGSFSSCSALTNVELPNLTECVKYTGSQFAYCSALERIRLPKITSLTNQMFFQCTNLKVIDTAALTTWGNGVCQACTELETIILRNTAQVATMAALNNNITHSKIASGTGYIYVPSSLVDSYRTATNWSTYASQFRALEDYTVDGTVTGDLDETKI